MLKIKSDSIAINSNTKKCIEYLSDLNNYQYLFPKDKINNWQSNKDYCIFSIQKAYTLEIVKESLNDDQIFLKSGEKSPFKFNIVIKIQSLYPHPLKICLCRYDEVRYVGFSN